MANKKDKYLPIVPKVVPKNITVTAERMEYSEVKLHIPKDDNGKATLSKPWYVWFNFRNPATGKFDNRSKIIKKHGINLYYKTISDRKKFGKNLAAIYTKLLQEGYNPFEQTLPEESGIIDFSLQKLSFLDAFNKALKDKRQQWSESTIKSNSTIFKHFVAFIEKQHLAKLPAEQISRRHVSEFLKLMLAKGKSPTTVNNYKTDISSVFSQMVENENINVNPVLSIKRLKETPEKNHPFTIEQLEKIKTLCKSDPLLDYMRIIAYSFLRNRNVLKLQVSQVSLENRLITARGTKANAVEKVFIVDPLYDLLKNMELDKYKANDFLITPKGVPGAWKANIDTKKRYFSKQFADVRKELGLGEEYTIYSIRHTYAYLLYKSFEKEGLNDFEIKSKMLPITRHRSIKALENYLRDLVKMMPQDYSDKITFNF